MIQCKDYGYAGSGYASTTRNSVRVYLHRQVYCQHNNVTLEAIANKVVRHSCDNLRCIEPTHLVLGTQADNMDDRARRYKPTSRKLSQTVIDEIVRRGRAGESQTLLAKEFSLGAATVSRYVNGTDRRKYP